MIRTIVVPLDGSPFGEHALPWAVGIARRAGAGLRLVHAHEPHPAELLLGDSQWDEEIRARSRAYLRDIETRLASGDGIQASSALVIGESAEAIAAHARVVDADLIVMTTHGRGGLERAWLGSVADRLVRGAGVPILLIRPGRGPAPSAGEISIERIVIPLDGSVLSEQILGIATEVGRLFASQLLLLRVLPPSLIVGGHVFQLDEARLAELRQKAEAELDDVAGRLAAEGFPVEARIVVDVSPPAVILRLAESTGSDLIAMTTHGRGGIARLLLGSVADKVLRGTSIPLLIYNPPS